MKYEKMDGWKLLRLIHALRSVGVGISIEDIQDALRVLTGFPYLNPLIVLESILIHRAEDRQLFRMIYQLVDSLVTLEEEPAAYYPQEPDALSLQCSRDDSCTNAGPHLGIGTGQGGITLTLKSPGDTTPTSLTFFQMPDIRQLMELKGFPSTVDEVQVQEVEFEKQVKFILGQSGFLTWANSLELAKQRDEVPEVEWQKFEVYKNLWNHRIRMALWQSRLKSQNQWQALHQLNWRYKPLDSFTAEEVGMVHQALRQMGNTLAVHPGLRKKKASRGTLRVSVIVKEMMRGNGLIFHLEYEKLALKHPELVILCDVSNSVAPFSQFLLYLCKNIKSRFRKVRIYLFIDGIWDITQEEWLSTEDYMEKIRSWGRKHSSGFTDYGKVFKEFAEDYLYELSARGTILILGDGRNNFRPAQAEYLQEISEKVRHIYWLNPLEEKDWANPDNLMGDYEDYCTKVFRCRTINDLWQISRKVFY